MPCGVQMICSRCGDETPIRLDDGLCHPCYTLKHSVLGERASEVLPDDEMLRKWLEGAD